VWFVPCAPCCVLLGCRQVRAATRSFRFHHTDVFPSVLVLLLWREPGKSLASRPAGVARGWRARWADSFRGRTGRGTLASASACSCRPAHHCSARRASAARALAAVPGHSTAPPKRGRTGSNPRGQPENPKPKHTARASARSGTSRTRERTTSARRQKPHACTDAPTLREAATTSEGPTHPCPLPTPSEPPPPSQGTEQSHFLARVLSSSRAPRVRPNPSRRSQRWQQQRRSSQ
jgi:hypothetical protein